jgi:4-amino-4-deoxy-L-arabinose transferase-like glycosyltransferase
MLWDESRTVANALEMERSGFSLVTTYEGLPDLWNTKPPLAIWLMVLSLKVFGVNEWALRLPTLLAAAGTVALTMRFAWRLTGSRFVTFASTLLLALSFGFYGYHAAWSAEYDSLLCLFTTAYLFGLFESLHRDHPSALAILGSALAVALAFLTKDIAALLPGLGVALYVLVHRRWLRLLRSPWYGIGAVLAAVLVAGFYLLREQAAPGYLRASLDNEIAGRYAHDLNFADGHQTTFAYYFIMLPQMFGLPPVLLVLLAAPWLRWPSTRSKAFLSYGAYVCLCLLLVLSLSHTRHSWYALPTYPVCAVMTAIVLQRLGRLVGGRFSAAPRRALIGRVAIAAAAATLVSVAILLKVAGLSANAISVLPGSGYGRTFADVFGRGFRHVAVLDQGVMVMDFRWYAPVLHDYALIWGERGLKVDQVDPAAIAGIAAPSVIASCDQRFVPMLRASGAQLTRTKGCAAVAAPISPR